MIGKRIAVSLAGLGAIALIAALSAWTAPLASVGGPGHTVLLAPRTASSGCKRGPAPDRRCSPGAYLSGLTQQVLCSSAFRASGVRPIPESASFAVEREYGIKPVRYGRTLVIDRIVPFVLGGSDDIANLFPEKLAGPAGYRVKDKLEARLHSMVCSREITLRAAQVGIAKNWQALYQKVFRKSTAPPTATPGNRYPLHTGIVATTFWVGEVFNASIADGSQVCSTYDSEWAFHWSGGVNLGKDPSTDCSGAPIGGCDGQPSGSGASSKCVTEARSAGNGYFPKNANVRPAENPFYLDLPFDDVNDSTAFKERCQVIPWAVGSSQCSNQHYSFMKNHWVAITGPECQHLLWAGRGRRALTWQPLP